MKREPLEPEVSHRRLVAMRVEHLDAVMQIENAAYPVPWTRGNFIDSLAGGCAGHCLFDGRSAMVGYCVAMRGTRELHLLNLTVASSAQRRGHARHMLDHLIGIAVTGGAEQVWLEVRASNVRALCLYRGFGFTEVGLRKAYYPAALGSGDGKREDAIAMSLELGRRDR